MGYVRRYQNAEGAASPGPLMDRMTLWAHRTNDIHLDVMRVPFEKLSSLDGGQPSSDIRERVAAERAVQAERFAPLGKPHVLVNGDMGPAGGQRFCAIDEEGKNLMCTAVRQMDLSVQSYHRVCKLARTIADSRPGRRGVDANAAPGRGIAISAAEFGAEPAELIEAYMPIALQKDPYSLMFFGSDQGDPIHIHVKRGRSVATPFQPYLYPDGRNS